MATDGAIIFLLMFECIGVDAVVSRVHHVIFFETKARSCICCDLEGLVATRRSNNSVGRCNGGDDVLDSSLCKGVGYTGNLEFCGTSERLLVEPGDMFRIVLIQLGKGLLLIPGNYVGPFDAMFGLSRDRSNSTERNSGSRGMHVELAFDAGGHGGNDDSRLALKAFGATVDHGYDFIWISVT